MQKIRQNIDIGDNLRRLRKSANLTQEQVTAQLQVMGFDISRSTYSKYEINTRNIKGSELVALKNIFKCSFDDFFEGMED